MKIRRGAPADTPRLLEIWRGAVLATHDFLTPDHFAQIEAMVASDYLPAAEFWVAAADADRPVGFMGLTGAHVDSLFVEADSHGRGVGKALLEHARGLAGPLTVDVNEQNAGAVTFYEKMGFSITGRSPTDDAGRPFPILHMSQEPSVG